MSKHGIKFFVLAAAALTAVEATADFSGMVYRDVNGNGMCDKGEKPMSGVCVSDGFNVTVTDRNGSFSLPGYNDTRFIFITTPSGYKTLNRHFIPVSDTVGSYDFGLIPYNNGADSNGAHSFVQLTDTEIFNTEGNEAWADDIRRYATSTGQAFIIHTGDICYESGLKKHIDLMNTENMGVPVFYCIGNHDLVKGTYGEELFESIYGPVYYSFDAGNTHYIVTPMAGGDHKPGYNSGQVARWMANDLAHVKPGTPVIVFNHDILTTGNDFIYGNKDSNINLNSHNLKAWVYGHWHINHERRQGNVLTVCTSTLDKGGIDHSTSAYRRFDIDRNGNVSTTLRYTYIHENVVIAAPKGESGINKVVANVYSSVSPVKKVSFICTSDGKAVVKSMMKPLTDFTWQAPLALPARLDGKKLTVKVEADFANGTKASAESEFIYNRIRSQVMMGDNWCNLAGNASHSGGVTDANLDSALTLAWTTNVGGNIYMTSPLIYDGKVFTATVDEDLDGLSAIYALDLKSGEQLWSYPTEASVKNSIAIDGGVVLAQDVAGNLYAVDCKSGALRWKVKMSVAAVPGLIEGLAAEGGIVYAGTGKALAAYKVANGEQIWQNSEWSQREGTTSTLSVGDGVVVGSVQWGALYGNDAATGKKLWEHSRNGLRNRGASAAIHEGLIYILSDKSLFVINARSGKIIVRRELPVATDATSTPLLTDTHIIFGTSRDGLMALDRETFEVAWTSPVGNALLFTVPYSRPESGTIETTPLLAGGIVWFAASDGVVYGVDEATGRQCWSYSTGAPFFGSVAASGNVLVATDFGGNVYTFISEKSPGE